MRSLLLLAAALLVAAPASAQDIERSFPAREGGSLELDLEVGGDLTLTGGPAGAVEIHVRLSGPDADRVRVEFDESGARLRVSSRADGRGVDADVEYSVRVPSRFDVTLRLSGGDVTMEGVSGTLRLKTMGGDLALTDLSGSLDAETMGGDVRLDRAEVDGRVHTMGGDIDLSDVSGDVDATTMGGDITFTNVRPAGRRALKVETMGGDVRVTDAPAGADLKSMGGDISATRVGGHARAETMGGDIDLGTVDGWLEAKTMGGDITAAVMGTDGDRHVSVSSMGGDIDLTLPSGLSVSIEVEIRLEGRYRRPDEYRIDSDFPLTVERTTGADARIVGTASVAGGRNRIAVSTTNGNVRIRRGN